MWRLNKITIMNCSGALAPPKLPSCSPNPIYLYTEIHNRTPVNFLHIMFHWQLRKWHRQKTCQICCWFVYCHGGSLYRTYGFCLTLLRYVFSLKHTWFGSHVKNISWFSKLAIVVQFSLSPKITIFGKYLVHGYFLITAPHWLCINWSIHLAAAK